MYYQSERKECLEYRVVAEKIESIEKDMVNIHSDLKMIKYLLVAVVGSILGTGVML